MNIVICGAGRVGRGIAERLAAEQNYVTVIDSSPELVQSITDALDVRGVVGHGSYPETLEQASIADADMLIAVTFADEVNMIACQVAHSLFDVPTKIARVRAQSYLEPQWRNLFSREHMPIDVIISPEVAVGEMVLRRLALPGAFESVYFVEDQVVALGITCDDECPVIDTPLSQLTELFPDLQATVVGIVRENALFVPHGDDQMLAGDRVYLVAATSQIQRALGIFGHHEKPARRILIAGGGNVGFYVAKKLEEVSSRTQVKIIEHNRERAVYIADKLDRTVVLHGDALEQALLREAGAEEMEAFVALTNNDNVNVLSAVMAKAEGADQTLSLVATTDFDAILQPLGIDATIDPRSVTVSTILQHVRRGRIRGVHPVMNGAAELVEAEALETSPVVGVPLRDAELPPGVRIGALVRGEKVLIPTGETEIKPRDRIVLFVQENSVREVEKMFRVSVEYF
ncbi:MAG: Trk system potassium transporter TrkA [Hyphomicrobiales bacterium]